MRSVLWVILCCISVTAFASDCRESLVDCREDCLLEFGGSVRLDMKHRYASCLVKCSDAENHCADAKKQPAPVDAGQDSAKPAVIEVQLTPKPDAGVPPKKAEDHDDLRFY